MYMYVYIYICIYIYIYIYICITHHLVPGPQEALLRGLATVRVEHDRSPHAERQAPGESTQQSPAGQRKRGNGF